MTRAAQPHASTARKRWNQQRVMRNATDTKLARAWGSMRILRTFTSADLQAVAEIKGVGVYLSALVKAGYLRKQFSQGTRAATYLLINDSGPLAPVMRIARSVYDPNTKQERAI